MTKKPKVVVIGGGSGISVVLRGLKYLPIDLTAIVSVADDGGSSGMIRKEFDSPPPGDLRNVLIALSNVEPIIEDVFQYRFEKGTSLGGHPLGNLLILAMHEITGDIGEAMYRLRKLFNIKAKILPACPENVVLYGEMEDGEIVEGESKIPNKEKKIKRVFFKRNIKAPELNLKELEEADLIVFGIGSLYTSVLPNLILDGIKEALEKNKGKVVYVCNAMQQPGETLGYTAYDHVKALCDVIGNGIIDEVIVDSRAIPQETLDRYKKYQGGRVIVDKEKIEDLGIRVVDRDILEVDSRGMVRHHPYKLAATLYSLIDKWGDFYV